jgi:hypothetical protein
MYARLPLLFTVPDGNFPMYPKLSRELPKIIEKITSIGKPIEIDRQRK